MSAARAEIKKSTPSGRTAAKEVRRQQLIDATINSIAKHGIGGTTMSTVTDAAGLSLGIVNFHFESKGRLLEETLLYLAREHHDQWRKAYDEAGLTAAEKLLAVVDAHFHPRICTPKKLAVWFAFFGEAGRRKVYRKLIEEIDRERYELSLKLCEQISEEGQYQNLAPVQIANLLEALYDGVWLELLTYPENYSRVQAGRHIHAFLASVYPDHFAAPSFD